MAPRGHQRSGHVVEQGAVRGLVAVAVGTVSCGLSAGSGRRVTSAAPEPRWNSMQVWESWGGQCSWQEVVRTGWRQKCVSSRTGERRQFWWLDMWAWELWGHCED